ncbi:MAG: HAD family phosphatase [Chitinophagaceae bacterium]
MKKPKACIFDVNGTLIDDMNYHFDAWSYILNDKLDANLSEDEVRDQMYGKNAELLVRVFGPDRFTADEMKELSSEKENRYQQAFLPHLILIPGLTALLKELQENGILMAIGSAAIPFNINFVLDNLNIRHYFKAIISADDVRLSKPDPETFLRAAELMQVEPDACIVFEDAPKGVEAAQNAGMSCIVLTTMNTPEEFGQYQNVLEFISDYNNPFIVQNLYRT